MLTTLAQLEFQWAQWSAPLSNQWWAETVCSMIVGLTLGVLGCFVVLRRMALIGDALSHAVLPGVVIAFVASAWLAKALAGMPEGPLHTIGAAVLGDGSDVNPTALLIGALIAGFVTAVLINLISRYSRTKEDSAIGIVFTALFAFGVILISALPRGTHFDLKCFLFGDPLAVGQADLTMMAVICPVVLGTVGLLYHRLKLVSFDPVVAAAMGISVAFVHYLLMGMLSATVVAGLKTTGVILVVAMVITPASAAYQLTNRFWVMLVLSGVFGAVSALLGMSLAFVTNSPTGPAMVVVAVAIFLVAMLFSPLHGVVFGTLRKRQLNRHIQSEDVLKSLYRIGQGAGASDAAAVGVGAGLTTGRTQELIGRLRGEKLVETTASGFGLTDEGRKHAERIVRTHRLWETYLNREGKLSDPELHAEAERLEHAHELADELDQKLGRPETDPHGSEIPREKGD